MTPGALRIGFLGVFLGVCLTLPQAPSRAQDAKPKKPADCIDVRGEASFASVGYDHIVTVKNECKRAMSCIVKTNVNPEPTLLELDPDEEKSVVTWRGSPAREFTPDVKCRERK